MVGFYGSWLVLEVESGVGMIRGGKGEGWEELGVKRVRNGEGV